MENGAQKGAWKGVLGGDIGWHKTRGKTGFREVPSCAYNWLVCGRVARWVMVVVVEGNETMSM